MFTHNTIGKHNGLADQAEQATDQAIRATQRMASEALDGLANSVREVRHEAAPMLNRANEQAIAMARRGVDAVRGTSRQVHDRALRAADNTKHYIRGEPVKSVLFAAAAGAALAVLIGLLTRPRDAD